MFVLSYCTSSGVRFLNVPVKAVPPEYSEAELAGLRFSPIPEVCVQIEAAIALDISIGMGQTGYRSTQHVQTSQY